MKKSLVVLGMVSMLVFAGCNSTSSDTSTTPSGDNTTTSTSSTTAPAAQEMTK